MSSKYGGRPVLVSTVRGTFPIPAVGSQKITLCHTFGRTFLTLRLLVVACRLVMFDFAVFRSASTSASTLTVSDSIAMPSPAVSVVLAVVVPSLNPLTFLFE